MDTLYLMIYSVLLFGCLDAAIFDENSRDHSGMTRREKRKPVCDPVCIHSTCIATDTCRCDDGYYYEPDKTDSANYTCKPHCDQCLNGDCIAPGECQCKEGYIKKGLTRCEPVCNPKCTNGFCHSPKTCRCLEGYGNLTVDNVCHPICKKACFNATCVAPNVCQCFDGYYSVDNLKHRYSCEPHCGNCLHGECTSTGECKCNEGYIRIYSECQPICKDECINGKCISPDECECHNGFEKSNLTHVCHATCEQKCINASCVAPNECKCFKGYSILEDNRKHYSCKPHCPNGCLHGDCIEPDKCVCHEGYVLSSTNKSLCLPNCSIECIFGTCVGPDKCECIEGYAKHKTLWYTCEPGRSNDSGSCITHEKCHCNEKYPSSSLCKSPNQCICKNGTSKSDNSQCTPKCSAHYHDGECYLDSTFPRLMSNYTRKGSSSVLTLDASGVRFRIPFDDLSSNENGLNVVDFICTTNLRVEENSAEIVCSLRSGKSYDYSSKDSGWPSSLRSALVTTDLIFLHQNSTGLREAHICSNSNREFIIHGTSNISMCLEDGQAKTTTILDHGKTLFSAGLQYLTSGNNGLYIMAAIIVASSIICFAVKCRNRKKIYYTRESDAKVEQIPLKEKE